ncbi:MAG: tRNA pseudouridine(55) synthase TruB [Actinomycetaceae bacterium]
MNIPRGRATAADGILLVDKPQGLTSHDVVARVRRLAATRKVGHAGTLDPMATGLLVLGIGRATRLLTYVVGADKTYEATIRLGVSTTTDDAEGETVTSAGTRLSAVAGALPGVLETLTGEVEQVPSAVSAIKVDGRRAYARVRDGEDVDLPARAVSIHELTVLGEARDAVAEGDRPGAGAGVVDLDVRISCSSGTYVRAVARDLGDALGVGGHLTALRRTAVGPFGVAEGVTLEQCADVVGDEAGSGVLPTSPAGMLARRMFPARELTERETTAIRYGQSIEASASDSSSQDGSQSADRARIETPLPGDVVGAFAPDGRLVALLEDRRTRAKPVLVLDPA